MGTYRNTSRSGSPLIGLLAVVVVIGVLVAIAIPNFIAMSNRAKEASTKANMFTYQVAVENYAIQHNGMYSLDPSNIEPKLGRTTTNPFSHGTMHAAYCRVEDLDASGLSKGQIVLSEDADSMGACIPNSYAIRGVDANGKFFTEVLKKAAPDTTTMRPGSSST